MAAAATMSRHADGSGSVGGPLSDPCPGFRSSFIASSNHPVAEAGSPVM
jgi:hypothetical protein